jgi:hypothetical protein
VSPARAVPTVAVAESAADGVVRSVPDLVNVEAGEAASTAGARAASTMANPATTHASDPGIRLFAARPMA